METTPGLANQDALALMMQEAIEDGIFPGAVLLVAQKDQILFHRAWGVTDFSTQQAIQTDTVFDLASLTKPLATALAVMMLIQAKRLSLATPMANFFPETRGTDKADLTVMQLLSHRSGWPAWKPYYEDLRQIPDVDRRERLTQLLTLEPLATKPGTEAIYSDLDFMALGLMIEACSGERLDRFVGREIYGPLGLQDLFFNPLNRPIALRKYAATERCPWRERVLAGTVHDDNAYVLNGVAGHAGLFGTALAVFRLLKKLMSAYLNRGDANLFPPELVRTFWSRAEGSDWALGFDTPSFETSSSGKYFSSNSVGHLGFTGTSFWVDIDRQIFIVLLTNRVHPSRANEKIRIFRPVIHDAIMRPLVKGE